MFFSHSTNLESYRYIIIIIIFKLNPFMSVMLGWVYFHES